MLATAMDKQPGSTPESSRWTLTTGSSSGPTGVRVASCSVSVSVSGALTQISTAGSTSSLSARRRGLHGTDSSCPMPLYFLFRGLGPFSAPHILDNAHLHIFVDRRAHLQTVSLLHAYPSGWRWHGRRSFELLIPSSEHHRRAHQREVANPFSGDVPVGCPSASGTSSCR